MAAKKVSTNTESGDAEAARRKLAWKATLEMDALITLIRDYAPRDPEERHIVTELAARRLGCLNGIVMEVVSYTADESGACAVEDLQADYELIAAR